MNEHFDQIIILYRKNDFPENLTRLFILIGKIIGLKQITDRVTKSSVLYFRPKRA